MKEYRSWHDKIIVLVKGALMGVADIIPGVSGGTVALISGIYDHLIAAIGSVKISHIRDVALLPLALFPAKRGRAAEAMASLKAIPWNFLLPLAAGILTGVLTVSKAIPALMEQHPFELYSFFFGLILFSISVPFRHVHRRPLDLSLMGVFAIITYLLLTIQSGLSLEGGNAVIFLSGAVAVCAMILPGVSGAYMLVMLGQYETVLRALHERDLVVLGLLIAGMAVGLFTFVRLLKFLLFKHHSCMMAILTGVMAGSVFKIWPFAFLKSAPEGEQFFLFAVFSLGGALFLFSLEKLARYVGDPEPPV